MGKLDGKVAVITGGASGIGESSVRLFVREGARVVIGDVQEDRGRSLAASLGASAVFQATDVSRADAVQKLVNTAVENFGRLDCMFNNAGFGSRARPIAETPIEEFDLLLSVLLRGVFLGMKFAAQVMTRQKSGTIVNTASVAGMLAGYGSHIYSTAKAGVIQLTRSVAMELGESGIRVNCICPGSIATPIFVRGIGLTTEEENQALPVIDKALVHQPIERAGSPDEIAAAALWLASDDSSFVTGHALVVDGGLTGGVKWSASQAFIPWLCKTLAEEVPTLAPKIMAAAAK